MSEYINKADAIKYLNDLFGEMNHVTFGNVLQSIDSLQTYTFPDSSENKGDLISRQAVLDELKRWDWQDLYLPSQFKQLLDDVPSVENKGEWVPITKWTPANDPPKETGRYLVYIVNEYDEGLQYIMTADYIARPIPIKGLSPWYVDDECASDNVVAWMPLPEGYKAESEESE